MNEPEATGMTIPALLAARTKEHPDRVALLVDGVHALTFAEWDARSNAVARGLLALGVRRGDRVGVLFGGTHWIDYAVAYMAVLKAGGAAVPLSERLAGPQVRHRIEHCGAVGCVYAEGLEPPELPVWTTTVPALDSGDTTPVDVTISPSDLAEILYTSGTTGNPKGVTATHDNVTFGQQMGITDLLFTNTELFLSAFPIGTTAGQGMLWYALIAHPTMVLTSSFQTDDFCDLIQSVRVGAILLVPAMAIDMVNARVAERYDLSSVTQVGSGSAPLPPATATALTRMFPNAFVYNYYGSTESAPAVTAMMFDPQRPASVGKPPPGIDMRISGEDGEELPPGEVGEVWLRSPAPRRSYYRNERLTLHTFGTGWTRMGDFGYLDEEGYLYLVDRESDVIKSGGLKVSTLQVEAALYEHPAIAEAAVVGVPHPVMGKMVGAAIVLKSPLPLAELRVFLRDRLAEFELPTRILVVDALPRGTLGKPLKNEVRALFESTPDAPKIAPSTPTEVALARMWTEVLDVPVVGIDDDFFALGGDSLKAAQLAARVETALGVEVSASIVFDVPVLAHEAEWIASRSTGVAGGVSDQVSDPMSNAGSDSVSDVVSNSGSGALFDPLTGDSAVAAAGKEKETVVAAGREGIRVPLGPFQERILMWMYGGTRPERTLPVCVAIRVREELDTEVFRRTVNEIARRHESLRTVFVRTGSGYDGCALPDLWPDYAVLSAEGDTLAQREEYARHRAREFVERPFDIENGPLFRALVVHLDTADNVVLLGMDHLVSDGLSIGVLLHDVGTVYSALRAGEPSPLPPLPVQCSDFFAWVRRQFTKTRPYWEKALAGAPAVVGPLPGQNAAAREQSLRNHVFELPGDIGERLRGSYRQHGVTPFMAGMAVWSGVLSTWTDAPEVVLLSAMSGRTRPEFQPLVGSVLQSPYFRVPTEGNPSFGELFAHARRSVVAATQHQFFPQYEFMSKVPYPARFSVDDWIRPPRLPGLESEPFAFDADMVPDRTLDEGETALEIPRLRLMGQPDGTIAATFSYNRHAFDEETVQRLADDFLRFADAALADPRRHLSDVT